MNYLSIMKKTATFLAIGATVLGALAADRADDGRGLIEAYASNNNFLSDVSPFRWYAGAITGGSSGGAANHAIDRSNPNTWAPESARRTLRSSTSRRTTSAAPRAAGRGRASSTSS